MKTFDLSTLPPLARNQLSRVVFDLEAGVRIDATIYGEGPVKKEMLKWADALKGLRNNLGDENANLSAYDEAKIALTRIESVSSAFVDPQSTVTPLETASEAVRQALALGRPHVSMLLIPKAPASWGIIRTSRGDEVAEVLAAHLRKLIKAALIANHSELKLILEELNLGINVFRKTP